jgi:hypothetical protein
MSVPARYRTPQRVYQPALDRISVSGYEHSEFYPTSFAQGALTAPQFGIYAAVGGTRGEYRTESDAALFRWFLEDTKCAHSVAEGVDGPARIEGAASASEEIEFSNILINALPTLTLTAALGVPLHDDAYGHAIARLYDHGEFTRSFGADSRLGYWTTIYTARRDRDRAFALARWMALRELADQVAAGLCTR